MPTTTLNGNVGWIADVADREARDSFRVMKPNGLMLHAGTCPICGQGFLGFWMCADQRTMILCCDDCETVYKSPEDLHAGQQPLIDRSGVIDELNVSVYGGRDATREEIVSSGWVRFIAGEYPYYKDKSGHRISAAKAEAEQRKRVD